MARALAHPVRLFVASSLAVLAVPLAAQDSGEDDSDTIVVIGRGLDQTPADPAYDVLTLDGPLIDSAASGRIEDVLGNVAGFQQFRRSDSRSANPSAQGVTLRSLGGNASSRALVLLDGVPVNNPFFGYVPFTALDPERLGQVRVVRGGGAGAFGAGALTGTIALESETPNRLAPVQGSAFVDQRGETQLSGQTSARLGAGYATAGAQWSRGEGFWTTPESQRVAASVPARFDSWSAQFRALAPLSAESELQASALFYDDHRTLRFEGADSRSSGGQASLRYVRRGDWEVEALGYVQAQDFANRVISSTRFVPVLDQIKTPATGLGGKVEVRPPVGRNQVLRLGADWRQSSGNLLETPISAFSGAVTAVRRAGGKNTTTGLFVEYDRTLGDVVLTGGLRVDRWSIADGYYRERAPDGSMVEERRYPDRAGWIANARGGLLWQATDAVSLRAAAYSGFRQPTLNELYRPFVIFPVTTQANAALDNERLRGAEVGIDLTPRRGVTLSVTAFANRLENAIANVVLDPTTRQRRNLDAIDARGLEAMLAVRQGPWRFDASLAWTDAQVVASGDAAALDGNRPAQSPALSASATLAFSPAPDWEIAATLRHVGAQFEDDLEGDRLPAATTLGTYAAVPITDGLALVLRGENLTGETIITRNQGGSIDLGAPRTLWAGARLRFD